MSVGSNVGLLRVSLTSDTAQFSRGFREAEGELDRFRRAAGQIGIAFAAAAAAAVAGLATLVNRQRQVIDESAKLAQRLDTTYASVINLGRAGELAGVGMQSIESASRQLDVNLGRAIQGSNAQAAAFDRLGLSARELANLPLDQRLASINQALRENVSAAERSAVAADIFGSRNAAAIRLLDPETISEAARQVEIFGLNLSDIDAAKVEQANDAMSAFGLLTEGIATQLTVELAPILKAIGDAFLDAAEEAGGMGDVVQRAVERAVSGLSFVADAASGVQRAFQLAGRAIAVGILSVERAVLGLADSIINGPTAAVNGLIRSLNALPGIRIQPVGLTEIGASVRSQIRQVEGAIREGLRDINQTALEPLAGEAIRRAYEAAQTAGQAAAEAAVQNRRAFDEVGAAADEAVTRSGRAVASTRAAVDTVQRQIDALVRQAATFGLSTREARLYELAMDGANSAQLALADGLLRQVEGLQAAQEEQRTLNALLDATPTRQLEAVREEMLLLERAFMAGRISAEEFVEAAQTRLGILPSVIEESTNAMDEFAVSAARNMQTALADFLFDPFKDGIEGMVRQFGQAIQRMIAEAAAAQISRYLFGDFGSTGSVGGLLGPLFGGFRASGGPVSGGRAYVVGERGPELFMPNMSGHVVPNHKMNTSSEQNVTINVNVGPGTPAEVKRAAGAGAREALAAFNMAQRYA